MELSAEQIEKFDKILEERKDDIDLLSITREVFGDQSLDGRSKEAKLLKTRMREKGIAWNTRFVEKKKDIVLTIRQKEYIDKNHRLESYVQMARFLFEDETLTNLSKEAVAVRDYVAEISEKEFQVIDGNGLNKKLQDYNAPKKPVEVVARINKCCKTDWKIEELKSTELKKVEALKKYLSMLRFTNQYNSYENQDYRDTFEDTFIRYTYDKSDLTQEEIDQFVTLATEVVNAFDLQKRLNKYRAWEEGTTEDNDGKKSSMSLTEAIKTLQDDYNKCIARQESLYKTLTGQRSKRLEQKISENASVLNLVEAWKTKESRDQIIEHAKQRKIELAEEVDKITTMDDLRAIVKGISKEEVLHG